MISFMLLTFAFQILLELINNKKLLLPDPVTRFHEMTQALSRHFRFVEVIAT